MVPILGWFNSKPSLEGIIRRPDFSDYAFRPEPEAPAWRFVSAHRKAGRSMDPGVVWASGTRTQPHGMGKAVGPCACSGSGVIALEGTIRRPDFSEWRFVSTQMKAGRPMDRGVVWASGTRT